MIPITCQADLDAALKAGEREFEVVGNGDFAVGGTTECTLRVSGSSQPRVEAYGSSQISTAGNVAVDVQPGSSVQIMAEQPSRVTGAAPASLIQRTRPSSVEAWCQEYGHPITDGVVVLYKAVRDDYTSAHGFRYAPESIPIAPDWDGGNAECGGGLHFAPRPVIALTFDREATRCMACPVRITAIRAPRSSDNYTHKVKASGCCGPIVEVDLDGEPIPVAVPTEVQL